MLGMRFDLRVPDFAPVTTAEQYQTCLEMADWADRLGFDFLALSEHHASPDGYLPAPIPLAAAILGRTGRIGVNIAAVLLVLHDPIRVAEELAVVDLFAPGRITVTAGLGYRASRVRDGRRRQEAAGQAARGVRRRAPPSVDR